MTADEFRRWAAPFTDALMLVSVSGRVLACNPPLLALMGRLEEEVEGCTLPALAPHESAEKVQAALRLWSGSGQMVYGLFSLKTHAGDALRCEGAAVRSPDGTAAPCMIVKVERHETAAMRFVGLNKKIDELTSEIRARKHSEELVRQQREWFHVTLASIGDAVIATDVEGCVEFMNEAAEHLTGWTLAESRGRPLTEVFLIFNEYTRGEAENPVQRVLREGCVVALANHTVLVSKNGTERPIEDSAAPIRASDGQLIGVVLVFHDVSERKKSEAALRASERRFRLWTELNVIATGIADLTGHFLEANEALLTLLGYTREDLEAGRFNWRDLTPPDQLERDHKAIAEARARGACQPYEKEYFHRDGRRVPVIIGYALFHDPARHDRQDTDELAICFIVDISDRKRAEAELELRVEERTARLKAALADLEAFSYTISHDLRAPLRSMRGYAEFLVEDHGRALDEEARGYLQKIVESGEHLDRMIRDVLTYTRVSKGLVPLETVELGSLLAGMLERYPHFTGENLRVELAPDLPKVRGNEALLTQCFSNLIGNALKFVPPERKPHVRIRAETREGRARVWVEDNGIGIAPEDRGRIFGIFERLHAATAYEGTGIGLSIVRRAVEKMGGAIGVESERGEGSRFWIELETPDS